MAARTPANARGGRNASVVDIVEMADSPSDDATSEIAGDAQESQGEGNGSGEEEEEDEEEEVQGETYPCHTIPQR